MISIKNILKTLFNGRLGRLNFFISWLVLIVGIIVVIILFGKFLPDISYYGKVGQPDFSYSTALLLLVFQMLYIAWWLVMVSIIARRWHDIGYGGPILIFLVPISLIPVVFLFALFLRGERIENKYGGVDSQGWSVRMLISKPLTN